MSRHTIALIGNPNCGKTTLFNALTGSHQKVGNWPGVTVERVSGSYPHGQYDFEVVDLPGTYSLDVTDEEVSLDERVARDYAHSHEAELVINILDAANIERNLYLTTQLAEMHVPLLVVLNMMDVARGKGMKVDAARLSQALGCPVVPIVASTATGIDELKQTIDRAIEHPQPAQLQLSYGAALENAIAQLLAHLTDVAQAQHIAPRWLAVRLLEGDGLALRLLADHPDVIAKAEQLATELGEDIDIMVSDARYTMANRLATETVKKSGQATRGVTERIDHIVLNRVLGIPIFLLMMYLMFMFTVNIGGAFIDFFDQFFGAFLVDGLHGLLAQIGSPEWLNTLVANGIGGGIRLVSTFVPIIGFLYLFLSVLEDSGYMARAAFVMDRFMRWIGLPGKSFVPLIVGFGCNVPAIMATRTLEHRRDRLMTIAMAPFMSCGARLPVYVLFAATFFPASGENLVFLLYLIGIMAAVLTGLVLKKTLLKGEASPFVMELPPYHLPTVRGVLLATWDRLKAFVIRAGRVIVPVVVIITFLNSVGTDGTYGNDNNDKSVLSAIGRTITPVFHPMGLTDDNWPAAVGIFTGVLAKEAVIGTLNASYAALTGQSEDSGDKDFKLGESVKKAFATIPANLKDAFGKWADPMGLGAAKDTDQKAVEEESEVNSSIFSAMGQHFDGTIGAFAYLLFILLYFPCVVSVAAVYQEAGRRWTTFVVLWTTGLGYCVASLFYQAATFTRHPASSGALIAAFLIVLAGAYKLFAVMGQKESHSLDEVATPTPAVDGSGRRHCC